VTNITIIVLAEDDATDSQILKLWKSKSYSISFVSAF